MSVHGNNGSEIRRSLYIYVKHVELYIYIYINKQKMIVLSLSHRKLHVDSGTVIATPATISYASKAGNT